MTPLTFTQQKDKSEVAIESPHKYVLMLVRTKDKGIIVTAEIYEIKGRRTPKMSGHFKSRQDALKWLQSYRVG